MPGVLMTGRDSTKGVGLGRGAFAASLAMMLRKFSGALL